MAAPKFPFLPPSRPHRLEAPFISGRCLTHGVQGFYDQLLARSTQRCSLLRMLVHKIYEAIRGELAYFAGAEHTYTISLGWCPGDTLLRTRWPGMGALSPDSDPRKQLACTLYSASYVRWPVQYPIPSLRCVLHWCMIFRGRVDGGYNCSREPNSALYIRTG